MIAKLGAYTIAWLQGLSSFIWVVRETISEFFERLRAGRTPFRLEQFFFQTNRVGVGSVPIITLISVFVGLTMALLTGYQLERFGIVTLVPAIVAISFAREMGPLFSGIILASRIGAAYTAELGAMTAGAEVDAIEAMGIGPLRYLVIPRFLAVVFMTPCLSILSMVAGIWGGMIISQLMLQLGYHFFYDQVLSNLLVKDLVSGVIKSLLFGAIIGAVACYKGLSVTGGAEGVGKATTASVVISICSVIACDSLCNIFIVRLFP